MWKEFKAWINCKWQDLFAGLKRDKCIMKIKKFYALIIILVVGIVYYEKENYPEKKAESAGIPDVVSSTSVSKEYYLQVVTNNSRIKDKEELARKIIHMCRDNSFHSTRFSVDIKGYPARLDITVYLNKDDMEEGRTFCQIQYETLTYNPNDNIKDDVGKYHLYLDGREIEFY